MVSSTVRSPETSSFRPNRHNHNSCITSAMQRADSICQQKGVRFTRIRKRVLELIWASHRPVLAYDLLKLLRQEKHNAEPPTIYRALDFLLENRLVHKIESLNAYVGCHQPQHKHIGQFLICTDCDQVAELDDAELKQMIESKAARTGFVVTHQTVEITGRCPVCRT